ncbi:MAG: non-hydrolyzing UDP-N-acetylglucosamine 2-epimerase [Thermoplasmatota archaeon]
MNIAVVLGTRPEIIKMSPIIRELEKHGIDFDLIHTGQHYDYNVSEIFFEELNIPKPDKYLGIGSGKQGEQTGKALISLEKSLHELDSNLVLIQGDTNTVLAGALAGIKMGLEVGHVEAGLRSYDYRMPEEYNRRLADHASSILFAPTKYNERTLKKEDVWGDIYVTGNTVIDACLENVKIAEDRAEIDYDIPDEFALITLHRAENVDSKRVLSNFLKLFQNLNIEMLYPIHPRAEKTFKKYGLYNKMKNIANMHILNAQGYFEFLILMNKCTYIITDSGGIQEEATAPNIHKKVFVARESTERPEAVKAGYAKVIGVEYDDMISAINEFDKEKWDPKKCPYGEGDAGEKIVDIIKKRIQ